MWKHMEDGCWRETHCQGSDLDLATVFQHSNLILFVHSQPLICISWCTNSTLVAVETRRVVTMILLEHRICQASWQKFRRSRWLVAVVLGFLVTPCLARFSALKAPLLPRHDHAQNLHIFLPSTYWHNWSVYTWLHASGIETCSLWLCEGFICNKQSISYRLLHNEHTFACALYKRIQSHSQLFYEIVACWTRCTPVDRSRLVVSVLAELGDQRRAPWASRGRHKLGTSQAREARKDIWEFHADLWVFRPLYILIW